MTLAHAPGISSGQHLCTFNSNVLLVSPGVEKVLADLSHRFGQEPSIRRALLVSPKSPPDCDVRFELNIALSMPDTSTPDWPRLFGIVSDTPTLLRINLVHLETCKVEQRIRIESEGYLFYHPWGILCEQFHQSLERMGAILLEDLTLPGTRDGLLFRFARTVELFHKLLRFLLASRGIKERDFKDALTISYQQHWITNEEQWISLLHAKFWVERAFDETRISPLVEKIPGYYTLLKESSETFRDLFGLD